MKTLPRTVILGGGLSGVGVALTLARAGWTSITLIERGSTLGGLAGSFEQGGHFYPLGYHHILDGDRTLLFFLDHLGVLSSVRWKRIRMLFQADDALWDLSNPLDFLRFRMSAPDKCRFVRLMLRAYAKRDWSDWEGRSAAHLLDRWAGPGVRSALFEPLTQLKFQLPCSDVSGAWMGARLHFREGLSPLGYMPHTNWTTVLCRGLTELLRDAGVDIFTDSSIHKIHTRADSVDAVELDDGRSIAGDIFVSTLPTEVYCRLLENDASQGVKAIRYTALVSAICTTREEMGRDFYWLNLTSLDHSACAIFVLSSLNPTIGGPDETCVNFVTHLRSQCDPFFGLSNDDLAAAYAEDFETVLGTQPAFSWMRVARIPLYSPIFDPDYQNPPMRSTTFHNMYFAGNYRTYPSVASTGTALGSGLETGCEILRVCGQHSDILEKVAAFRPPRKPRG